jgi:hypothetical protein
VSSIKLALVFIFKKPAAGGSQRALVFWVFFAFSFPLNIGLNFFVEMYFKTMYYNVATILQ